MKITNRAILFLILIVAFLLRFTNFSDIPFTHDEFSAIFRLRFDSFSELIEKGVKVDGHPAGVHVFLYYWTKLFGFETWVVKLPFAIFGVLSVLLIYLIGKKWFNETVGLLSASFLASIQFTVMYSQIARPYISGLFFSLLMVYFWSNLIKTPEKKFYVNAILFVLSASLCAYNHHFSLLFAFIVGISGLFCVQKKYLKKYIFLGVLILMLYLPHLKIFLYQLNVGGVGGPDGWLGKPHNDFLIDFLNYVFHFSLLPVLTVVGLILFGAKDNSFKNLDFKRYILFFSWFILPFLIGFLYSTYVNPVLQYSMLIFSLPYLFFLLFGHFKEQKPSTNLILVIIILLINGYTLIANRKHYDLFYQSVYLEILKDYEQEKQADTNTLFIIDSNKKITEYYTTTLAMDTNYIKYDSFQNLKDFQVFLVQQNKLHDKLYLGSTSFITPEAVAIIQDYYPYIKWQHNYVGGSTYHFSKTEGTPAKVIDSLNFENSNNELWSSIQPSNLIDSIECFGSRCYLMDSTMEFSPTYARKLEEIISNENNFIDISVKARKIDNLDEVVLVATLESNGENIYWRGVGFNDFIISDANEKWDTFYLSIKLADVYIKYDNIILKVYLWNRGKKNFYFDNLTIKLREGNPIIYGLTEGIRRN